MTFLSPSPVIIPMKTKPETQTKFCLFNCPFHSFDSLYVEENIMKIGI